MSSLTVVEDGDNITLVVHPPAKNQVVVTQGFGPRGAPGSDGVDGAPGADGVDGVDGAPGPKGDKGDPGDQGPQGIQGLQGLQGVKGDKGDAGSDGVDGAPGADSTVPGPQGPKGDTGNTGAQGIQGIPGAASTVPGPQGPKGDTGDTGPQGIQGVAGAASTIPGPQGPKGDTGNTGAQGIQGIPGTNGTNGTNGVDGKSILATTGAPSNAVGVNGEWAFDKATKIIYGPKAAGVWPAGVSLGGAIANFRGPWASDAVVKSYSFADGTIPADFTKAAVGLATLPSIVTVASAGLANAPANTNAVRLNNVDRDFSNKATLSLNLAALGISGITRVTAYLGNYVADRTNQSGTQGLVNGSVQWQVADANNWTLRTTLATSADTVAWAGAGLNGNGNYLGINLSSWLTQIDIYATADPYMSGQHVTHLGRLWRSVVDNNSTTPGTGGSWVEVLVGGSYDIEFAASGAQTVKTYSSRKYITKAATIQSVVASLGTAPTGATFIVDVLKNGVTIFTTGSKRPQIVASSFMDVSDPPDVTALAVGDYLQIGVTQIGSTVAGSDLQVAVTVV